MVDSVDSGRKIKEAKTYDNFCDRRTDGVWRGTKLRTRSYDDE